MKKNNIHNQLSVYYSNVFFYFDLFDSDFDLFISLKQQPFF
jgi:hypothetical protein